MQNTLLITGTDTDVGKTILTTVLVAYWQTYYAPEKLGLMKLMQTGVGDRETYQRIFDLPQSPETLAPLVFETPVAPPIAADREGRRVDLAPVWQTLTKLQQEREWVLVEALGGLGSPVTHELTVADIASAWRLPVVLVVPVKLGAIAQTVANVALARQTNLMIKGIVLNCVQPRSDEQIADWTPIPLIESLTQVPVLGILPHLAHLEDKQQLTSIASNLQIESILPPLPIQC